MNREQLLVWMVGVVLVIGLVNMVSVFNLHTKVDSLPSGGSGGQPSQGSDQPSPSQRVDVSADDDTVLGDEDASVTIIEFSDYQCPFCNRFWSQTLPLIKSQYIDTGKVKFVYRDFPLSSIGHVSAQKAAEAAECADDQGKYWEMHDKLFEKQQEDWGYYVQDQGQYLPLDQALPFFKQYAQELGLDTNQFNDCLDSGKYTNEVQKDFTDGTAAGVRGTPAFYINGLSLSGAQPISAFQQVIEAELA